MDTSEEKASGEAKEKVTGNSNHMLAYFGALILVSPVNWTLIVDLQNGASFFRFLSGDGFCD